MLFKASHSILLVLFVLAVVFAIRRIFKGRNASANAWMLPFAYFSLIAWVLWVFQYGILVAGPFGFISNDSYSTTSLLLELMQNAFWIVAILSLHSKQFSQVSLTLALLGLLSIVAALIIYETPIVFSEPFTYIAAVSVATIFTVLAASIWKLPVSKLYPIVFGLHGFSHWLWTYLFFNPSISIQKSLQYFSLWHVVLMLTWIILISEMLVRFRVMISSTIDDLGPERRATERAIRRLDMDGLRSETLGSRPYTPKRLCKLWAEQCNLFVLIIGGRYGHYISGMGKSAVEFEYEVAAKADREKILVYVKEGITREPKLEEFLERLRDFECGHVISPFNSPEDLSERIQNDVKDWLTEHRKPEDGTDHWS